MSGGAGMEPLNRRSYENQGADGGQRRKNRLFAPVTMKMIADAQPGTDDACEIDGESIQDIIVVGRVIQRLEEPMRTIFEINDNTGTFKVIFYLKEENQIPAPLKNFNYEQFAYVKVLGTIRVFKEEKAIVGTHIKRIEKFDELTNHLLQVFVANQIRKKGVLTSQDMKSGDQHKQQQMGGNAVGEENKAIVYNVIKTLSEKSNFAHKNDIFSMLRG